VERTRALGSAADLLAEKLFKNFYGIKVYIRAIRVKKACLSNLTIL